MCECIKNLEKQAMSKQGGDLAQTYGAGYIVIGVAKRNEKGIYGRRKNYYIDWLFCPFCGLEWQSPQKDASIPNITNPSEPTGDKGEVVGEGRKIKKS